MLINRINPLFIFFAALFLTEAMVHAQREIPHIPPAISPDGFEPDLMQPFIEPGTFDLDLQFFSPFEINGLSDGPEPPTGFFFTYDRMYINLSRQDSVSPIFSQTFEGDFHWGNRLIAGYMTQEDHGWDLDYMKIAGGYDDIQDANLDRNSATKFFSIALNKTFRQHNHYGSYFESYMGARFIFIGDKFSDQSPSPIFVGGTNFFKQHMRNQIIAGQIGTRYVKQKGRWTLSADLKLVAGQNFQSSTVVDNDFDGAGGGALFEQSRTTDQFVPMGEFRLESSYHVTRDISLRFGLEMMLFARGINRADPEVFELNRNAFANLGPDLLLLNDQDMMLAGVTFGVVWQR